MRLRFLLLLVFLASSSFLLVNAQADKPAGRIVSLSGIVTVKKGGVSSTAKPFQNLDAGDVVITGSSSRAAIRSSIKP